MKKKFILLTKIIGFTFFYIMIMISSIFLTMNYLIKGKETKTPELIGKNLKDAYKIATKKGFFLKKTMGNYDNRFEPNTVINQFPAAGVRIKEKSYVRVFITSEVSEVTVPDLTGYNLKSCEAMLIKNSLRKGSVSYMNANDVPVDFIISQYLPAGEKVAAHSGINLLVSQGRRESSFVMPDLIGLNARNVTYLFEKKGLKISKIKKIYYAKLDSGIIIKQHPSSGFRINSKTRIALEVSE